MNINKSTSSSAQSKSSSAQEPSKLYLNAGRLGLPPKKVGHAVHFLRAAVRPSTPVRLSDLYRAYLEGLERFPSFVRVDYELEREDFYKLFHAAAAVLRVAETVFIVAPAGIGVEDFIKRHETRHESTQEQSYAIEKSS